MSNFIIMDQDDAHYADGQKVLLAETDGEALIESCCLHNACDRNAAINFIQWADEHMVNTKASPDGVSKETIDAVRQIQRFYAKVFRTLIRYIDSQSDSKFIKMAVSAMAMTCDFTDEAGAKTAAELARLHKIGKHFGSDGQGKQTVSKCIKYFCDEKLHLPPLPGQRSNEAKKNMKEKRLQQLQSAN